MNVRSKLSIAVGLSCVVGGLAAGGAMAHGGGRDGDRSGLEVKVRGVVTALTEATPTAAGSITVSPGIGGQFYRLRKP